MIEKIRCIDANAKDLAYISNSLLKKSRKFAQAAYSQNILNSKQSRFNKESIKAFYKIGDFYDKNGDVKKEAKPIFEKALEDIGLTKDATLLDFARLVLGTFK